MFGFKKNWPPQKNDQDIPNKSNKETTITAEKERAVDLKEKNKKITISERKEVEEPKMFSGKWFGNFVKKASFESATRFTGTKSFFSWLDYRDLKKDQEKDLEIGENVTDLIESIRSKDKLTKEKLKNDIRELKEKDPQKYQEAVKLLWENRRKKDNLKKDIFEKIKSEHKEGLDKKKIELAKESINTALVAAGVLTGGATAYGTVLAKTINNLTFNFTKQEIDENGKIQFNAKNIIKNSLEKWKEGGAAGKIGEIVRYTGTGWMTYRMIKLGMSGEDIEQFQTSTRRLFSGLFSVTEAEAIVDPPTGDYNPLADHENETPINSTGGNIPSTEKLELPEEYAKPKYSYPHSSLSAEDLGITGVQIGEGGVDEYGKITIEKSLSENFEIPKKHNGLWSIVRDNFLKTELKGAMEHSGFSLEDKTDAEIENITGNLFNKIKDTPEKFGFPKGFNPYQDQLPKGMKTINFQALYTEGVENEVVDYSGETHDNLIARAKELNKEDIENINNYEKPTEIESQPIEKMVTGRQSTATGVVNVNQQSTASGAAEGSHVVSNEKNIVYGDTSVLKKDIIIPKTEQEIVYGDTSVLNKDSAPTTDTTKIISNSTENIINPKILTFSDNINSVLQKPDMNLLDFKKEMFNSDIFGAVKVSQHDWGLLMEQPYSEIDFVKGDTALTIREMADGTYGLMKTGDATNLILSTPKTNQGLGELLQETKKIMSKAKINNNFNYDLLAGE